MIIQFRLYINNTILIIWKENYTWNADILIELNVFNLSLFAKIYYICLYNRFLYFYIFLKLKYLSDIKMIN